MNNRSGPIEMYQTARLCSDPLKFHPHTRLNGMASGYAHLETRLGCLKIGIEVPAPVSLLTPPVPSGQYLPVEKQTLSQAAEYSNQTAV
jgi:hypothetical protein